MDSDIDPADCDRCGDRYPRTELFEVAPTSLAGGLDATAAFEAVLCEYCVADLRNEVFGGDVRFDNTCLE